MRHCPISPTGRHHVPEGTERCVYCDNRSLVTEQTPPQPSTGDIWLLVVEDMRQRREHGIAKYGQPVQADNGRDHLIDAYQEALDLCVYLRAEIEKRKAQQ